LDDFKRAAASFLEGAGEALERRRVQLGCYLVHVGLECLLKARFLACARARDLAAVERRLPRDDFEGLFRGKSGHNLQVLAEKASLRRFLEGQPQPAGTLLTSTAWRRLCGADRPYSVRYHWERIADREALEELTLGRELEKLIGRDL